MTFGHGSVLTNLGSHDLSWCFLKKLYHLGQWFPRYNQKNKVRPLIFVVSPCISWLPILKMADFPASKIGLVMSYPVSKGGRILLQSRGATFYLKFAVKWRAGGIFWKFLQKFWVTVAFISVSTRFHPFISWFCFKLSGRKCVCVWICLNRKFACTTFLRFRLSSFFSVDVRLFRPDFFRYERERVTFLFAPEFFRLAICVCAVTLDCEALRVWLSPCFIF